MMRRMQWLGPLAVDAVDALGPSLRSDSPEERTEAKKTVRALTTEEMRGRVKSLDQAALTFVLTAGFDSATFRWNRGSSKGGEHLHPGNDVVVVYDVRTMEVREIKPAP